MTSKTVSAATVTYFSELTLIRPLLHSIEIAADSLYAQTGYHFEFYIVDNSPNEEYFWKLEQLCAEVVDREHFRLHMIRASGNLGYSGGNNFVLGRLKSDYHIVINPDVTVKADALARAVEYLNQHDDIAMLSPKIVNGAIVQHVVKDYPDCLTLALRYLDIPFLNNMFPARLAHYQREDLSNTGCSNVSLVGGCFLFVRTSLFRSLGGFDDRFFMYFEDYDLSIRLKELGRIVYLPAVEITHLGGYVGKKSIRHHVYFSISALKFFTHHGWRLW